MKQLEGLVGRDNRLAVARVVLYKAAAPEEGVAKISQVSFPERLVWPKLEAKFGNMPIAVFDANKMRKNLGLSNPEGLLGPGPSKTNRQTLEALLEGSNVSVDRLDGFLKVVGKIQSSPTGDPATFLTRRIILGGGLVAGAAIGTQFADPGSILAPISLGTFIVSGRALSRLLSSPKGLALLREGFEPNLTTQQFLAFAQRFTRAFPDLGQPEMMDVGQAQKVKKGPITTSTL